MNKVLIVPENIELTVTDKQNILDAGLKAGLNLPHGCKNGGCGACKCKVISGDLELETYNHSVLTDEEREQGYTLLCKAHAKNEVVLEIPHLLNGFPIRTMPARVEKIDRVNNTAILTLKLPATQSFGFYAGQYIDIILQDKNRSYSIASCPSQSSAIEIHVRYHKSGVFSEFVWNELKEAQLLRFKGPLGSFQLSDEHDKPTIMVCTGTGFAPIKSILQEMAAQQIKRELYVYWGNRTLSDYYLLDTLYALQKELNFKLTLCLSQDTAEDFTPGYVTTQIEKDFNDLSDFEIYACGNLNMIGDVYKIAGNKKLLKQSFFSDAFIPSV